MQLQLRDRAVDPSTSPLVMGVLNVTPDSFSDGGSYSTAEEAVARAFEIITEGADIIDIGPESTRPGSRPVAPDDQIARAVPVVAAVREANPRITISIDTRLAPVAQAALDAGADMINDISALGDDPGMVEVVARSGALVCLMHRKGRPIDMQHGGGPYYDDVIGEISRFLRERIQSAVAQGVDESRIIIDPGIGFGKRIEHNLMILKHLECFAGLGRPVLVGASRKSFIGKVLGAEDPKQRGAGSLACAVIAALAGAAILRVHDVRPTVEALRLCTAVRGGGYGGDQANSTGRTV